MPALSELSPLSGFTSLFFGTDLTSAAFGIAKVRATKCVQQCLVGSPVGKWVAPPPPEIYSPAHNPVRFLCVKG